MKSEALISKHFSPLALRGIEKAGDLLAPETADFPRFSETGNLRHIDRIADFMNPHDREGFQILMSLFAVLPRSVLQWVLQQADHADSKPAFLASTLRLINLGVKGVVYSLSYTDLTATGTIRKALHWNTRAGEDPYEANSGQTAAAVFSRARHVEEDLRSLSVSRRLEILGRLKEAVLTHQEEILDAIQTATGKSRSDALMSEIFGVLDHLDYLKRFAPRVLADRAAHTPLALLGKKSRVWFEPLGPILVISPWNYPFYQCLVPVTSALVCGNPVVYKPSELTPMTGLIEKVFETARIPGHWLQIVYGDGKVGSDLIEQKPAKIFFTGSTRTGRKIMEQASKHLIPVELELGGKDPMIVFEDATLERAVAGAAWGALTNSGQSCTSVERLYVQESIYEEFRELLVREVSRIQVGFDSDGSMDMGRMTSPDQIRIIQEQLEDALAHGAKLLSGQAWDRKSPFIPPLLLEHVTPQMRVIREESFGPFIPLIPFRTEAEAIQLANDSEYGLSASVWSRDLKRAERVSRKLVTGNVSINNVMLTEGNHALPFGGTKNSGFGRFKGEFGFYSFSNIKSVVLDSDSAKIEANWYPFTPKKLRLFNGLLGGLFGKGLSRWVRFAVNGMALESHAAQAWKQDRLEGKRPGGTA